MVTQNQELVLGDITNKKIGLFGLPDADINASVHLNTNIEDIRNEIIKFGGNPCDLTKLIPNEYCMFFYLIDLSFSMAHELKPNS